ncbi:hypothetical protein PsorP6_009748 [Peronosclerospora sorghi]|uniref:Uncharacterized protein n=1 Tax=Peronosclerospora sorghi TaxID=230839 RepID=A0ACC0VY45_9STRA|nr:hypothetical protein PsorP6_009748 [Peronosclerospora sorghi]
MSRTPFQPAHELKYGLKVMHIDQATKRIVSVRCQFCVYFGKEDWGIPSSETDKQNQNMGVNYTKVIIRDSTPPIGLHNQALDHDAKKKFFITYQPLSLFLHRGIIEVFIGDVFFNPDDHGSLSHQRVLALFVPEIGSDNAVQHYTVRIKNPLYFQLVTAHLSHGLSFRQVAAVLESSKLLLGVVKIESIPDAQVSNFARILVAVSISRSLTRFLNPLKFLDFPLLLIPRHIVFHYQNPLHNIHVAALPMSERHTAVNIYDLIVKVFNVLCPSWRKKALGIASDGANVMTGQIGGVVTLLERDCLFPIHTTWCMLHQIDLVVKERVNNLLGGEFISIVNKIAHNLRKQENLIREKGSKCPKMTTRWLALGSWSQWQWQLQHYEQLNTFFSSRRPDLVMLPEWYWPIVADVFALFETVNRTMRALQNRNLLMTQQRMEICSMIDRIKKMTEVEGPLTDE